ncbi:LegK7 family Dot/Icm T4SS effector kinase [Legionella waltersii]|uniref:Protein kinase domain containing protein n=1 Tax=Legionella waltersii TaxID=66969 RepID=A0A0W1AJ72_9GAMM|nr:LegK7 family Dot/Icm T4SS effector kinase [Legionella waltersii]KTD81337.1 protein kinase domain containing protein [Legionella waltersii]SNV02803.1 protein kinase domain containing protein [Legionella waltersii]
MPLTPPPHRHEELNALVALYNKIPKEDAVKRLYFLQKINYELNQLDVDSALYQWMSDESENGWLHQLSEFGINRFASFTLKGIQFVQAISASQSVSDQFDSHNLNFYQLLQERDELLKATFDESTFQKTIEQFIQVNAKINHLVLTDESIRGRVKKQLAILKVITPKLLAIQGQNIDDIPDLPTYLTKELGHHVNNYNYKLVTNQWDAPFVLRVEDRSKFGLDQELLSYEASKYFLEDYAVFMLETKIQEEDEQAIVYRPVILGQFANQNNLREVAKQMHGTNPKYIGPQVAYYFEQIIEFSRKLIQANVYFPDIKLTNFLTHNDRILVSDRKTIITDEQPFAKDVRSTPSYAPDEYYKCLNLNTMKLKYWAYRTKLNMPQFMAYQVGIALKEALILTQLEDTPSNIRDNELRADHYFDAPSRVIINLSLLAQELTRSVPSNRLSLDNAATLIRNRNLPTEQFYALVEKMLPSSQLGIVDEVEEVRKAIKSNLRGHEFLAIANPILAKISQRDPKEPRLSLLAEQLAENCFKRASRAFYLTLSQTIEKAILDKDWEKAPWYRKAIHWISFGYIRVERVTEVEEIVTAQNTLSEHNTSGINAEEELMNRELETHLTEARYIPSSLLKSEFGETVAGDLEDYFYSYLETKKTPPQSEERMGKGKTKNAQKSAKVSKEAPMREEEPEDSIFNSLAVVIHEEVDTLPKPSLKETPQDTRTILTFNHNEKAAKQEEASGKPKPQTFFAPASQPKKEHHSKKADNPLLNPSKASGQDDHEKRMKEVDLVPSLMFLGDCGSRNQRSRRKKSHARTHVSKINWTPPTDVETSESLKH